MRNFFTKVLSFKKEEKHNSSPTHIRCWEEIYAAMEDRVDLLKKDEFFNVFKEGVLSNYIEFGLFMFGDLMTKEERAFYSDTRKVVSLYVKALSNFFNNEPLYNKELWIKWYLTYFDRDPEDTDLLIERLYDLRYEAGELTPIRDFVRTVKEHLSSNEYIINSVKKEI